MKRGYIAVAGGVNIDICARADAALRAGDSNPGRVRVSPGGVGGNVARSLRRLGAEVELLSAFGTDAHSDALREAFRTAGVSTAHSLTVPDGAAPTYLAILAPEGDMALAVSDMALCEALTPEYFAQKLDVLNGAALVVLDTNLPRASVEYLARHVRVPLFADPVSSAKAEKLASVLPHIHTLKPNRIEAETLSGVPVRDGESAAAAARELLRRGVKRVFLSLGADGVLAAEGDALVRRPACVRTLRSASGAGDAMTAALAWSYLNGETAEESAALAMAAAAITAESAETVAPALSPESVRARAGRT